jgi:hypothetical protein
MWGALPPDGGRAGRPARRQWRCREPRPTMETIASELLLMALLLAVVILSGTV